MSDARSVKPPYNDKQKPHACVHTGSPEGSPLYILTAESHMYAFLEKGAKGHVLSQSPVHLTILHQLNPTTQDPRHTWRTHTSKSAEKSEIILLWTTLMTPCITHYIK